MASPRRAIIIFGRFQPPTKGHERLFKAAAEKASRTNAMVYIFPSQTHGDGRNPLSYRQKIQLMTPALRTISRVKLGPNRVINPADALTWAKEQGITDVLMYVGDDRLMSFKKLVRSWSAAVDPKRTVTVTVSSMPRTGAWDASKISGTAAKAAARADDFKTFQNIVISRAATADVKDAMHTIQQVKEGWDMDLDIDFGHPPMLIEEDESFRNTLHAVFETDEDDENEEDEKQTSDADTEASPESTDTDSVAIEFEDEDDPEVKRALPAVFEADDDEDVEASPSDDETSSGVVVYDGEDDDSFIGTLHAVFETDEDPAVKDETLGAVQPREPKPPDTEVIAYPQSGVSVEREPPKANDSGPVPSDTPSEKSFVVISPKRHLKHELGVKAQARNDQNKNAK